MQIGQILVEHGWVDPAALARALDDQPQLGRRICSLLILRGELDADNAARALSLQHGVPGVLQKHLEHRDLTLPASLPAELARGHIALPIGRTSLGALIVCVRDPRPPVIAAIAAAVAGRLVVAVAPAYQLEHLVAETYQTDPDRGDLLVLDDAAPGGGAKFLHHTGPPVPPPPAPDDDIDVDLSTRQIPVIGDPLAHLGTMTLVELDDARVDKDPSQSGQHEALVLPRTSTGIGLPRTSTGIGLPRTSTGIGLPRTSTGVGLPPRPTSSSQPPRPGPAAPVDASVAAIEGAGSFDAATDAAMSYLAARFQRAVWFAVHDGAALGERGHGDQLTPELIEALAIPLASPSIVQLAHDTRQIAVAPPALRGPIQDRLSRALGGPHAPAAVPIEIDAEVAAVIAVGDPIGDPAGAPGDLARVGAALAAAFQRLAAR